MSDADLIIAPVVLAAILAAFALGWVAGAAYVRRLRRALNGAITENRQLLDARTKGHRHGRHS